MTRSAELDLVIQGATGFTGRLVAEHLFLRHPPGSALRWGLGGRNPDKLERIRAGLGERAEEIPIVVADSGDRAALEALADRARVVASTVGPFSRFGSELVAACARRGTDYCDITGEVQWIRRMIDAHEETARESGARIVHCCGFDSIPSDLGVRFLQDEALRRFEAPLDRISLGVRRLRGSASGGTIASMLQALEEAKGDREVRRALGHPYSLNPRDVQKGPDGADQKKPRFDEDLDRWTAPFVMATVNTRIVRRSNALLDFAWGRDFEYRESMITGRGLGGRWRAIRTTSMLGAFVVGASLGPTRALLEKFALPAPGEGPSAEERERGSFEMLLVGSGPHGTLRARVTADRDPGYGATSRMLGETGACLAEDELEVGGGSWTPASAFGATLVERLVEHAGMTFELVE